MAHKLLYGTLTTDTVATSSEFYFNPSEVRELLHDEKVNINF